MGQLPLPRLEVTRVEPESGHGAEEEQAGMRHHQRRNQRTENEAVDRVEVGKEVRALDRCCL